MSGGAAKRRTSVSGERPGRGDVFAYDEARHLAAYGYAATLAAGRDVLDAGCGEGFGTQMLAATARSVVGIDHTGAAITLARRAYDLPNLTFRHLDVCEIPTLADRFDLITNFQVLEHLPDPKRFLAAARAGLRADGALLLSTPNRLATFSENPYHLREYVAGELEEMLRPLFSRVRIFSMTGNDKVAAFDRERSRQVRRLMRLDPLGLRHRLPTSLLRFVFMWLSVLVRHRVERSAIDIRTFDSSDFTVVEESRAEALDLVAFCRP